MVKILKADENTVKFIFPYSPELVNKIKAIECRKEAISNFNIKSSNKCPEILLWDYAEKKICL